MSNRRDDRRFFNKRVLIFAIIQLVLGAVVLARLVYLQVYRSSYYKLVSDKNRIVTRQILPTRGTITDAKGRILATNKPMYMAMLDLNEFKHNKHQDVIKALLKRYNLAPDIQAKIAGVPKLITSSNRYIYLQKNLDWSDLSKAFTSDLHFFKGMASLFTAYSCVTGVYPVYEGFKHQKSGFHKMKLSTLFSVILVTLLHILSITVAFLTEPIYPEDIIIYRKPKDNGKDILMNIAKFAIAWSLFFYLPGYYFGLRLSIANSFTGGKISNRFNYLLTFISLYVCAFIAAVYDKILNYLSYVGGFFSCFICYLFPILLYIKTTGKPITYWKNLIEFIGAILLCVVGVTAGILTIRDDINGK